MEKLFKVSSSPHIHDKDSIQKIMLLVVISLLPALGGALYFFGLRALWVVALTVASCVVTEAVIQKMRKKPVTVNDFSAVVTGMLLAYNVPAEVPLWMPVLGGVFAIAIAKQAFGGLGYNPVNPALAARAFMLASWPVNMTVFKTVPRGGTLSGTTVELFSGATPLNTMKQAIDIVKHASEYVATPEKVVAASKAIVEMKAAYGHLFWGNVGGCLGETSAFLLLLGAILLFERRIISWRIPFTYIGTVALLSWVFGGPHGLFSGDPIFHILAGGLILGAFFMATDMVTSPVTPRGQIYFGVGMGLLTVIIRLIGGYPEGVSYSILLMNLTVPLLDRFTRPKILGESKKK